MRKYSLLALALSCCILPALAQSAAEGTAPVLLFRGHDANAPEIVYTKLGNVSASDTAFAFTPVNGDKVAQHYTFSGNAYSQIVVAPPPATPDFAGFSDDIAGDNSVSPNIYQFIPILSQVTPAHRKAVWARVTASPPGWLTAQMITTIQTYAAARNLPLQ